MNSDASSAMLKPPRAPRPRRTSFRAKRAKPASPHSAHGEPLLWLTGGALVVALAMIVGLLIVVIYQGVATFWPAQVIELTTSDGTLLLGERAATEEFKPTEEFLASLPADAAARARQELQSHPDQLERILLRTGNFDLSGTHYQWIDKCQIAQESHPDWALVVERLSWGRFYGIPVAFLEDDVETATDAAACWSKFGEFHRDVQARRNQRVALERHSLGAISYREKSGELSVRAAELKYGKDSAQKTASEESLAKIRDQATAQRAEINQEIDKLNAANSRLQLKMKTADGQEKILPLEEIVRAYPANQLGVVGKLGIYLSRWKEFLWEDPREANSEGGVFPAIFGTVVMTLVMSFFVAPFGVLAALYLREYAKAGPIVSAVRIAINNLAGVPSVVFGAFGLGFFCYGAGSWIDQTFFTAALPTSTFGTGGLLWASLTLALLTLPVVIVTTEEAIAAVPSSMREGSYACGASKWQTIRRIVLPRALPGIMTGMILAMARGAGEVAPLMLVGAVKMAADLPVDTLYPFIHAQRKFMHLAFHIFDLGFQSSNSEAAKPMVYTTTLLLIAIIAFLNIAAVWLRGRLRRKFVTSHF
jgi:phosphate transport system permease protein